MILLHVWTSTSRNWSTTLPDDDGLQFRAEVVGSSKLEESDKIAPGDALSYHFVRQAIASGMLRFGHIPGECNAADILSKHWGYSDVWPMLKPLLFYEGDTSQILLEDAKKVKQKKK